MTRAIENFITVSDAAKQLKVDYFALLSWMKRDVGNILTDELVVKKSSWLIHTDAVEILQGKLNKGEIHSGEE